MLLKLSLLQFIFYTFFACANKQPENTVQVEQQEEKEIIVGAARFEEYLHLIEGKKVGMVVNQTSSLGDKHLVDEFLERGIEIKTVFAPEHGFRGTADAGEKLKDGMDAETGLPIVSLYGPNRKPKPDQLENIDIVIFDIQDVGTRFYTYISTLEYVMEACAEQKIPFLVLDRPNPNGHYIDGPILDTELRSFVGMQQIPVVHGMTVGEYASFLNGEKLLKNGVQADLTVVTCENYDHNTAYEIPIPPSPNLPNQQSILLYPSLCFFEGTTFNAGRGTTEQFQVFGHPEYTAGEYSYTPISRPGAKSPKWKDQLCYGENLSNVSVKNQLNLNYIISAYQYMTENNKDFFLESNFFDKLAGTYELREQIKAGKTQEEIRASWQEGLANYKQVRKKYLLYKDFE